MRPSVIDMPGHVTWTAVPLQLCHSTTGEIKSE